jgi:hypothetical protein
MQGNRVLYADSHIGGGQYRVTLRTQTAYNRDQFYFDKNLGAIRWLPSGGYILSIEKGPANRGRKLVIRGWAGGKDNMQRFRYHGGEYHNFHSYQNKNLCVDSSGGRNTFNNQIIVWSCHNGQNQKWSVAALNKKFNIKASGGVRSGKMDRFQIVTRMRSNRVIFYNEHIGGNQHRLRIRNPTGDNREWWVYHPATKSIRLWANRGFVISNQRGLAMARGKILVMRAW